MAAERARLGTLVPFLIAAVVSIGTWVWVHRSQDDVSPSTEVMLVLMGLLFGFVSEIIIRLREMAQSDAEWNGLLGSLHAHPELLHVMTAISSSAGRVQDSDFPERYKDVARDVIVRCSTELGLLAEGFLYKRQGDTRLMLDALQSEDESVFGITECSDLGWWTGDLGNDFRTANAGVVKRGGCVKRVFILCGHGECCGRLRSEMEKQHQLGIRCYFVNDDKVPPHLFINATVIGDVIAHEDVVNGRAQTIEYRYVAADQEIARIKDRIEGLIHLATPFAGEGPPQIGTVS
jgi:hypothetical protein